MQPSINWGIMFRPLENSLLEEILIMILSGMIAVTIARIVLFWMPRRIRRRLIGVIGGLGVLLGGWFAIVQLHL